jgi:IBR domain, a half RING-finger domain
VEVLFSDGVSVERIRTGTDISCITITNLPLDTTITEIDDILSSRLKLRTFKVSSLEIAPDGQSLLTSVTLDQGDANSALDLLSQVSLKNVHLNFQATPNGKEGHMLDTSLSNQSLLPPEASLTVTWDPPSAKAVVAVPFTSRAAAYDTVLRINETVLEGRRLRASLKTRKLARIFSPIHGSLAMEIDRLPINVTGQTIVELSGCPSVKSIKRRSYFVDFSLKCLRRDLSTVIPGGLKEFRRNESSTLLDGSVSVTIRFHTWNQACRGYLYLFNPRHRYFGRLLPRLDLFGSYRYSIHIPIQQYKAQQSSLNHIVERQHSTCNALLCCTELESRRCVALQVVGDDEKAVGALKVKIEKLVAGEKFYVWHNLFESDAASVFFKNVYKQTGIWIIADRTTKFLKLFGERRAIASAKQVIGDMLDELGPYSVTIKLQQRSVEFFLESGASVLRDWLGHDKVTFDILSPTPSITIQGGEDVKFRLQSLLAEALSPRIPYSHSISASICPICLDDVTNPVRLRCRHVCCDGCIRHLLTTACDTKSFPLVCVADEGKCKTPLSMNIIQRYLTPTRMCQLFETAFSVYMTTHPQEYRYCPTNHCSQTYRVSKYASPITCPSCFSLTCACCHEEWHQGYTCKEWQAHLESDEQERLFIQWTKKTQNVRKCPQCTMFIEKVEGCHKVQCRCKAMICWKCMSVFPKANIYNHMTVAHGGVFDVPD